MERLRQVRDAIKNRYNKPCCIKLSVGIGVGLLLLVVVVIVATVAGDGGDHATKGRAQGDFHAASDSRSGPTTPPEPRAVEWPHQFAVQLESQGFSQILAIDDVSQRYIIEINKSQNFNLYIIVDFQKRQHIYLIMEKGENEAVTNVVEKTVLYCESSPFAEDFNGLFTTSSTLREGGTTYREQVSGRTATLDATYMNTPYTVSAILVTILEGSCQSLPSERRFKWKAELSACGNNTTVPADSPACSNKPCPTFEKTSLSTRQACTNFRKCNYVMARCDSSWTKPYDQRPYCVCRSTIVADTDNINCPSPEDDGGECLIPKRDIQHFESVAACYCRYRISRIYPKTIPTSVQTISWEIKATIRTAPVKNYRQCPC